MQRTEFEIFRWLTLVSGLWVSLPALADPPLPYELDTLTTRALHRFAANLTLAPVQLPFPMEFGGNFYFISDARWMLGLDVAHSRTVVKFMTNDIDSVSDTHIAAQVLRFLGNSFHVKLALGQRYTDMQQIPELFDLTTYSRKQTLSSIETKFFRFGVANLWHFRNRYSIGVDWLGIEIPFGGKVTGDASKYAKTPATAATIRDNQEILVAFPNISFMKLQLGAVF